mgnify:CR=1 FL=1
MSRKPEADAAFSRALDGRLRAHYRNETLSVAARERILANTPEKSRGLIRRPLFAGALGFLLCALLVLGGVGLREYQTDQLYARLADEIAYNHRKAMPVEFASGDLRAIAVYLDRLDFALSGAQSQLPVDARLLGARYCKVDGQLAAQLQLERANGRLQTLYVAPARAGLAGIAAERRIERSESGPAASTAPVRVVIWQSAGLFFGLAEDARR